MTSIINYNLQVAQNVHQLVHPAQIHLLVLPALMGSFCQQENVSLPAQVGHIQIFQQAHAQLVRFSAPHAKELT